MRIEYTFLKVLNTHVFRIHHTALTRPDFFRNVSGVKKLRVQILVGPGTAHRMNSVLPHMTKQLAAFEWVISGPV